MDDICRLCCSAKYVSNYIFDDENALYLKMSLYMPIKVFKNDKLPQKICDKCSCKVNDLYQFCNEAIEVENRLRELLLPSSLPAGESIDLTLVKRNVHSPVNNNPSQQSQSPIPYADRFTQTEANQTPDVTVKVEPPTDFQIKIEFENGSEGSNMQYGVCKSDENTQEPAFNIANNGYSDNNDSDYDPPKEVQSDDSDLSLLNIKRKKRRRGVKLEEDLRSERKPLTNEWAVLLEQGLKTANRKESKVKEESETVLECCVCSERVASRAAMLQHYKGHASDSHQRNPPPAPPPPPALRCPRCSKKMDREGWPAHWARHWERDHRPFRCAICEKSFRQPYEILRHGETHRPGRETPVAEKRFICDTCPERFIHMKHLQAHRSRAHPEARSALRLRCAQCAREFAHLNSLRRHLVSHSGVRDFLCNVCGKKLSSREHLKLHIRIHTGHKPHACATCGKSFVKKCNLTLHERVHSGEKPHVCSHCGKAFNQRSTLVIHERYHSGARPYACHLCGRGFVAKGLLSMHLKNTCI